MKDQKSHRSEKQQMNQVLLITVLLNLFLVILKVLAGTLSNSKGLIADGYHSASDVITTLGVIVGMYLAKKPRDEEHPYGHEKIETVAAFLLAIILLFVGFRTGIQSLKAIFKHEVVVVGKLAYFSAIISIALKELQYQITMGVSKKLNSNALKADAWHHRSDALSSIAALIGLVGASFGFMRVDAIMGVAVSVIVAKVGWDIFKESFHGLIDVSIQQEELVKIKKQILQLAEVYHINDIRTRIHGSVVYVDVRVCVDPYMEIHEGHQVADQIEAIVKEEIQHLEDVIVHLDPCFGSNESHDPQEKECKIRAEIIHKNQ